MKRIAIIINSLAGGGAEKVMLTLSQSLISMGHKVTLFSLISHSQYELPKNINVVFPFENYPHSLRGWTNRKQLAALLGESVANIERKDQAFDLTLVNLHESYRIVSACQLNNCHYVIHNSYVKELQREILMGPIKYVYMRQILKMLNGKCLIGVSKGVTKELKQASLFSPQSVRHIYNPCDITAIQHLAKQTTEVAPPNKYILHVGRAAKAKRHDVLFSAMQAVNSDYKLVCLSANVKKLTKLVVKYGVEDRVVLPGFTQNPYAWMKGASLVVLSSDFEGLSMVLLEALICNTPVVSTNCPHGPSEILQGVLRPYLVEPGNVQQLGSAINKALKANISVGSIQSLPILQELNANKVALQYLALCDDNN